MLTFPLQRDCPPGHQKGSGQEFKTTHTISSRRKSKGVAFGFEPNLQTENQSECVHSWAYYIIINIINLFINLWWYAMNMRITVGKALITKRYCSYYSMCTCLLAYINNRASFSLFSAINFASSSWASSIRSKLLLSITKITAKK